MERALKSVEEFGKIAGLCLNGAGLHLSENNRIFFYEMMWYMSRLFHIGFEVDFFVNQLLGPLSLHITSFRAKYHILLANKSVIVPLSIGAGRPVP